MRSFRTPTVKVAIARLGEKQADVRDVLVDLEGQLNARLVAMAFAGNLIGQPFAICSVLTAAGLDLGEKFAPCDGRTIKDKASPFHGRAVPTITDQLGAAAGTLEWFVRIKD